MFLAQTTEHRVGGLAFDEALEISDVMQPKSSAKFVEIQYHTSLGELKVTQGLSELCCQLALLRAIFHWKTSSRLLARRVATRKPRSVRHTDISSAFLFGTFYLQFEFTRCIASGLGHGKQRVKRNYPGT